MKNRIYLIINTLYYYLLTKISQTMLPKIRYRLVWNYANKLNAQGMAMVAVECRQERRKMYIKSNVMLRPNQWSKGMVVNHDNADKLTAYLTRWRNQIEEIELNALLKGRHLSLSQLKTAIKTGIHTSANLKYSNITKQL